MKITNELVAYVANLSRICLDEQQTEEMKEKRSYVLEYMDVLGQLDTTDLEPLSHVFPLVNAMREDTVMPSYKREELLKNAPEHSDETFIVPKTVE